MVVSCVDVNSGKYVTFDESAPNPVQSVVASASIPFIFPHQDFTIEGQSVVCMDGGTVWNTNLVSAVQRCRDQVDDDSEITLDIVICGGKEMSESHDSKNAYSNFLRFRDIRDYYNSMGDIVEFKQAFPNVNYRHFVMPSSPLASGMGILNFDNSTSTWPMQQTGRNDGEAAQTMGEGRVFSFMDEWVESPEIKAKYPQVGDYVHEKYMEELSKLGL